MAPTHIFLKKFINNWPIHLYAPHGFFPLSHKKGSICWKPQQLNIPVFLKAINDSLGVCTTPAPNFLFNFIMNCMILIYREEFALNLCFTRNLLKNIFFLLISEGISDRIVPRDRDSELTFQSMLWYTLT